MFHPAVTCDNGGFIDVIEALFIILFSFLSKSVVSVWKSEKCISINMTVAVCLFHLVFLF